MKKLRDEFNEFREQVEELRESFTERFHSMDERIKSLKRESEHFNCGSDSKHSEQTGDS